MLADNFGVAMALEKKKSTFPQQLATVSWEDRFVSSLASLWYRPLIDTCRLGKGMLCHPSGMIAKEVRSYSFFFLYSIHFIIYIYIYIYMLTSISTYVAGSLFVSFRNVRLLLYFLSLLSIYLSSLVRSAVNTQHGSIPKDSQNRGQILVDQSRR